MSKKLFAGLLLSVSMLSSAVADDMAKKAPPAKEAPKAAEVDLNSAPEADIAKLTGVGAATAKKIVAARPFAKPEDLVSKKLLTQAQFDKIKTSVVAKEASKDAAPPEKTAPEKTAPKK